MDRHRPAHHQRLQDVGLELVDRDEQAEGDQRIDEALGQQRDNHRQEAAEDGTDQRDERAEEHQRSQRQRQRHGHDHQPGADAQRVDQRHQEGGPDVADQRTEAGAARGAHPLAVIGREHLCDVVPDVAAAIEEEDQREHHQQCGRDDFGDRGRGRQGAAGQLFLIVLQRLDRRVAGVVDLLAAQMKRPFDQPFLGGVDAAGDLVDQIRYAHDELADDEGHDSAENREAGQDHQRHRATAGCAAAVQPVDDRHQQRAQHQRQAAVER